LTSVDGRGLECRVSVAATTRRDGLGDGAARFDRLTGGGTLTAGALHWLAREAADVAVALVRDLAPAARFQDVLAVGVHEPGLWHLSDEDPRARIGVLDTARLTETTGLTVIDDFPARDLAQGGQGGPVDALAQWVLLADPRQCRLLIDLGHTTRMTYLPPSSGSGAADRVLAMDVGPGMALLDRLAAQLTEGRFSFDPGGTLAVQGRQIPELLEQLLAAQEFQEPPPRWHPHGVAPDWFLDHSIRAALESGWSMRDLLCTATHLIAESIARAVARYVPRSPPLRQMVFSGGGQQNGLLLREIARRLPEVEGLRVESLGIRTQDLNALSVAVLTVMHLDQVPQTRPFITGTDAPRLLGRITPGSPKQWQLLLRRIHEHSPSTMSLRSAV
jgi:anhydro-N-acetylmuramic acid kinase